MARRRRRKSRRRSSEEEPEPEAAGSEEDSGAPSEPDLSAEARADLDRLCLTHPTRPVVGPCDGCGEPLCTMCTLSVGALSLCNHCFEARFREGAFRPHSWQGWVGLLVGLVALASIITPYSLGQHPELMEAFPGGRNFFGYSAAIGSAAAVILGFSAQDFGGLGKRAGAVAVVFGVLSALAIIGLNFLTYLGPAAG